jgi:hypothetical protein
MFIPIVRRSVEARTRQVIQLPFSCDACGSSTRAHIQAEGTGGSSNLLRGRRRGGGATAGVRVRAAERGRFAAPLAVPAVLRPEPRRPRGATRVGAGDRWFSAPTGAPASR